MAGVEDIRGALEAAFHEGVYKAVLSDPVKGAQYRKVTLERKRQGGYLVEKLTQTQAFHENVSFDQAVAFLCEALGGDFRQYNGWDDQCEHALRVTAKGKILSSRKAAAKKPKAEPEHNREKQYLLKEGAPIPPLVDLGVFTKEGKVARPMWDKYRQINRFLELIADEADKLPADRPINIIDFGCGKSYLTFILYYFYTEVRRRPVRMTGLDLKRDVIDHCNQVAQRYGYEHLRFEVGDIRGFSCDFPVDIVISLHACDTATDYALLNAVRWGAKLIFCAPCCQHELAGQIASEDFSILTRYGIIKERTAALMTDAIRANLLEATGYRTQLIEFIDLEHTPKNLLLRARRTDSPKARRLEALKEVDRLCAAFALRPMLYGLLEEIGLIG